MVNKNHVIPISKIFKNVYKNYKVVIHNSRSITYPVAALSVGPVVQI